MNSLTILMNKNTETDLSEEEYKRARSLIVNNELSNQPCSLCKISTPSSIEMTMIDWGLCKGHALHVLATGR